MCVGMKLTASCSGSQVKEAYPGLVAIRKKLSVLQHHVFCQLHQRT